METEISVSILNKQTKHGDLVVRENKNCDFFQTSAKDTRLKIRNVIFMCKELVKSATVTHTHTQPHSQRQQH